MSSQVIDSYDLFEGNFENFEILVNSIIKSDLDEDKMVKELSRILVNSVVKPSETESCTVRLNIEAKRHEDNGWRTIEQYEYKPVYEIDSGDI